MEYGRSAGILLHPTSLPSRFGIGDFGLNAYKFIDFLVESGQKLWQIFPLGPTGYGDSPYQCFSAFAGNHLLISPELLLNEDLLEEKDISGFPNYDVSKIDYGSVINQKTNLFRLAFNNFKLNNKDSDKEYKLFCDNNEYWLEDYALFMSSKEFHNGVLWTEWAKDITLRTESKLNEWRKKLSESIGYQKFLQFIFDKQWKQLRSYTNDNGIKIIGDIPIFIAYDSADLWANKDLFSVRDDGSLETVAGVPPDYFSETGQLWGNPLYKWKEMEKNGFRWWKNRIKKTLELVDIIRIDHFRGFDAYWEIPGGAPTAIEGRWVKAPGYKLFNAIKDELGDLPILAEDLGVITSSVEKLRDDFNFPGMKILQFAFGKDGDKKFLPHNHIKNCVVFTGSHDNDTTRGFFEKEKENGSGIFEWAQEYLGYFGDDIRFEMIRAAYKSVANIVIIPMQDILNLGTEARMNMPGNPAGNWQWRFYWEQIDENLKQEIKNLCMFYERPPEIKEEEEFELEVHDE